MQAMPDYNAMSDEDFERDANAVLSDLVRLKHKMERP